MQTESERLETEIRRTLARRLELQREIDARPPWKTQSAWHVDRLTALASLDRFLESLRRGLAAAPR
jgi:hypothetical protein